MNNFKCKCGAIFDPTGIVCSNCGKCVNAFYN